MSSCAVEKAKIEFSPVTYAQKLTQKYNEIINNHKRKADTMKNLAFALATTTKLRQPASKLCNNS